MLGHIPQLAPGLFRRVLRFLLPVHCANCGSLLTDDRVSHFCAGCWSTISLMPAARCARCDHPFPSTIATTYSPHHTCQTCVERPPSYTKAWTLYPYVPPLQNAICLLKYHGKVSLVSSLAALMIDRLPPLDFVDLIMPVPLHPQRLREREFNQSLLLADHIGRHLDIPVSYANLIRTAHVPAQTTLSRTSRLKNLRRAFTLRHPDAILNKRILLMDDVFTTGTTVNECAKTLRRAGSDDVFVMTLGRTMDSTTIPDRIMAQRSQSLEFLGG
jgi:ComF family protein